MFTPGKKPTTIYNDQFDIGLGWITLSKMEDADYSIDSYHFGSLIKNLQIWAVEINFRCFKSRFSMNLLDMEMGQFMVSFSQQHR